MKLLDWLISHFRMDRDDWPPPALKPHWDEVATFRRYYDSDRARMLKEATEFRSEEKKKLYTPVPLAAEICGYSSELLFSEEPSVTIEDAATQKLLREILDAQEGFPAFLLETGATIATEGRGALRVEWDNEVADVPIMTHVSENRVIWDLKHGRFVRGGWVILERKKNKWAAEVYRLVEEHRPGFIERALFKGRDGSLGDEVPLTSLDEFASLEPFTETGLDKPTLIKWDNVPGGVSDIARQLTLLDRLNEFESLGVEKVRKSRALVFADRKLADRQGGVDTSGVIFTGGAGSTMGENLAKTVEMVQPDLQAEEHLRYVEHVRDLIVTTSGYSLESFGESTDGNADSGRALKLRMTRTLLKKAGKDRMARDAIRRAVATACAWRENASEITPYLPKVELGDGLPRDELELAEIITQMEAARAISTRTKVKMFHPEWTDKEVDAEVEAILSEAPESVPPASAGAAQSILDGIAGGA